MLSHQQNNPDDQDLESLSFSIRDYVWVSRQKDLSLNWPFRESYLSMCLQHGVRNLLPPLECYHKLSRDDRPLKGASSFSNNYCSQERKENNDLSATDTDHANFGNRDITAKDQKTVKLGGLIVNNNNTRLYDHQEIVSAITQEQVRVPSDHQDQIMTDAPRWLGNAGLLSIRQRKRRKEVRRRTRMRSIAEIYADAKHCTLDDDTEGIFSDDADYR